MEKERIERIRERVLSLIEAEYESDASFERAVSLPQKTVNNWRRCRSASFMKMLPRLSEIFSVNVGELLDIPLRQDTSELSDEELEILSLYRRAGALPPAMRSALRETLEATINLYITAAAETKPKSSSRKKSRE